MIRKIRTAWVILRTLLRGEHPDNHDGVWIS